MSVLDASAKRILEAPIDVENFNQKSFLSKASDIIAIEQNLADRMRRRWAVVKTSWYCACTLFICIKVSFYPGLLNCDCFICFDFGHIFIWAESVQRNILYVHFTGAITIVNIATNCWYFYLMSIVDSKFLRYIVKFSFDQYLKRKYALYKNPFW